MAERDENQRDEQPQADERGLNAGAASPNPDVPSVSQRATRPRDRSRTREAEATDTTVPGGQYIVGNNVVNANGEVIRTLEQ